MILDWVYTVLMVVLGFVLGLALTTAIMQITTIDMKTVVKAELGYYERTTGDFKLINLEEACKNEIQ